jgi:SAM-dependent methyltransferase
MPIDQNRLFDRDLLLRRRERFRHAASQADFLLRRAAEDMLERLDLVLRDFPLALDLGAGHGLLSGALAARANIGRVIASDRSTLLLDGVGGGVKLVLDEERLPFGEGSLNLVTALLSLHFVNDLPGALVQIRRALAPDGLLLAALPGGQTLVELRTAFMLAEEEVSGGVSPRVAPMADLRDYGALLQRAGFALPVVDSDVVTVSYADPFSLMRELRLMGGGNVLADRLRRPTSRRLLLRMAEIYHQQFGHDGRIPATFEIIHLSGWAPHASQQQPLAPGSAQLPLAAALGACALPPREDPDEPGDDVA